MIGQPDEPDPGFARGASAPPAWIPRPMATWTTAQWATLVGVLVLVIVLMVLAWPRQTGPDHVVVRVVNGPTVLSTQVVPLR